MHRVAEVRAALVADGDGAMALDGHAGVGVAGIARVLRDEDGELPAFHELPDTAAAEPLGRLAELESLPRVLGHPGRRIERRIDPSNAEVPSGASMSTPIFMG